MATWTEKPKGSDEQERLEFDHLAKLMMEAQLKSKKAAKAKAVDRAFHARSIAAFEGATFVFNDDLPEDLRVGFAQSGAQYPALVRFSNAASVRLPDTEKDFRGLAVRVLVSDDEQHDLLATNFPVSHARDAHQFVYFAHALAGGTVSRLGGMVKLMFQFGPSETIRMLRNVLGGRSVPRSLALESYWSRGAMTWGDEAVRFIFRPAPGAAHAADPTDSPAFLETELANRLAGGDVRFEFCIQRYVNEEDTPIEDTAVEWSDAKSPAIPIATLVLPQRDLSDVDAIAERREIDQLGFNPWNTTDDFRPLGHLNRARKAAYDASIAHRQRRRWQPNPPPLRNRVLGGGARAGFRAINRRWPWYRLPLMASLLNLDALRHDLRQHNLIDTEPREAPPKAREVPPEIAPEHRIQRSYDGSFNDLSDPKMGAVGAAFGRNMPAYEDKTPVDEPNAVTVSDRLMQREQFIPATILNVLAAAWIQFQVHDWVAHARRKLGEDDVVVKLPPGHPGWINEIAGEEEDAMRFADNIPRDPNDPSLFANASSHWWDGSEVYGSSQAHALKLRDGAKLKLDEDKFLPVGIHGFELTGFNESWWMGLSVLHTLFAREHNLLCDELRKINPTWSDERVYQTARLIVSALIAKIHTVEWTPAILSTEALDIGMKTNWYGPPSRDWLTRLGIWLTDVHALKGIPMTEPDHHTAPYSLTEEFVTVYRMHPLLPDDYIFYDFASGAERSRKNFLQIQGKMADDAMRDTGLCDALYSFGVAYPGAITLHNFPESLRRFEREGEIIDLAVVDLMRTRKRGVPRYNGFRRGLRMPEIKSFDEMTANPETNRLLKEIYGDVDKVDTVVGLLGEQPPPGFGFSDTAFRIFILMASRRLQSDRFLNVDFKPEIYTPFGMDWIENNGMTSLILRHCPELASVIPRNATAFAPWQRVL
ncbi:peroxidase family protein [Bauldia sp.]|uniref:peroxidase family protein n=1 Tax=Bauldia sp. TaxID=2575872 RepID=UPI003BAD06BF